MATNPIEIVLSGNVAGCTQDGSLSPILFGIQMTAQDAHAQLTVNLDNSDVAKAVALPAATAIGPTGGTPAQTLLVIKGDRSFDVSLNGGATYELRGPNAMLIISGGPDVTALSFDGASPLRAKIQVLKVVGTPTPDPTS